MPAAFSDPTLSIELTPFGADAMTTSAAAHLPLLDVMDPTTDLTDGIHLLSRAAIAARFQTSLDSVTPAPAPAAGSASAALASAGLPGLPAPAPTVTTAPSKLPGGSAPAPVIFHPDRGSNGASGPGSTGSGSGSGPGDSRPTPRHIIADPVALRLPSYSPATNATAVAVAADAATAAQTRSRITERHHSRMQSFSLLAAEDADPRLSGGLSAAAHAARILAWGANVTRPLERRSAILRYLHLYTQPFMLALLAAAILSLAMYGNDPSDRTNLIVGVCLIPVIIFSCSTEFYQENKSSSRMSAFAALVPRQTLVLRAGRRQLVPASTLAPGDVVVLRTGDQVAADLRLIAANGLKIDASAVTGEAEAVHCSPFFDGTDASDLSPAAAEALEARHEALYLRGRALAASGAAALTDYDKAAVNATSLPINEARNIAFAGCNVLEGEGLGIVFATASRSMVGQIVRLASSVGTKVSSMQREIARLVALLAIFAAVQVVVVLVVCVARGDDIASTFTQAVVVIILANIPQGLPTVVMTAMTVIAARMTRQQVYVKQLANIETLGCATVIATDKTGTLTQNKMTVTRVWADGAVFTAEQALEHAHPSAVFTRFDPLAFVNAHAYARATAAASGEASATPSSPTAGAGRATRAASLVELVDLVGAVAGDAVAREHHSLAIVDIISAVCNQTRYEDESASAKPAEMDFFAGGDSVPVSESDRRLESYRRKDWVTREDARAAAAAQQLGRAAIGEPSDLAIFNYVAGRQSIELLRYKLPAIFHMPFNSTNKFMLTATALTGATPAEDRVLVLLKGAPEIVLARCAAFHHGGRRFAKSAAFERRFTKQYLQLAGDGERVIACAYLEMAPAAAAGAGADSGLSDTVYEDNADAADDWPAAGAARAVPLPVAPAKWSENTLPGEGFTFVGLLSLADPPKATVPAAVRAVRAAGVRVVMVTGDHPLTAKAIARQVGIITLPTQDEVDAEAAAAKADARAGDAAATGRAKFGSTQVQALQKTPLVARTASSDAVSMGDHGNHDDIGAPRKKSYRVPDTADGAGGAGVDVVVVPQTALVATGTDIRHWTEEQWTVNLQRPEIVFARTTPQQKLEIVEHLQRLKHVVCVTGDGVNDSPALKKANIGVAMGISGSDVAREAADIILLDDDFSAIVAGIKEGRLLFQNLAKAVGYTLTHATTEIVPTLARVLFGIPLALSSMGVLAIDCGTELAPSVALAYEPPEAEVMTVPPRDVEKDRLVTGRLIGYSYATMGFLVMLACFTSYFTVFLMNDIPISWLWDSATTYWRRGAPVLISSAGRALSDSDQLAIVADAQVSYWMTLVLSQVVNIFLCKTRFMPFWRNGLQDNKNLLWGVCIELTIMFCLIFIPTINSEGFDFGTIPGPVWAIPFGAWFVFFAYAEGSKLIRRKCPDSFLAKVVGF